MYQHINEKDLLLSDCSFPNHRNEALTPIQLVLAQPDCPLEIPPLLTSAKVLLGLPEKNRRNTRFLVFIAQKDPVFLARLLCLAGHDEYATKGMYANTANDAVALLGVSKSLSAMLNIANVASQSVTSDNFGSPLFSAQQFVLRRSVAYSLTALRLAAYLELTGAQASKLQVCCLLDSIGLYIGLYANHESSKDIQQELSAKGATPSYFLRNSAIIPDYHLLSMHLARRWRASSDLIESLQPGDNPSHALMVAIERMVDAKLRKESQKEALLASVANYTCWTTRLRRDEIDLAVLPW